MMTNGTITPLACALLELAARWASAKRRGGGPPTYEATRQAARLLAWKWSWCFTPEQHDELDRLAAKLCGVDRPPAR